MRRILMLLVTAGVLFFGYSRAQAQTVAASGTVDWTALTNLVGQSAEIVFFDLTNGDSVVAPLAGINSQAHYAVTLRAATPYFVTAVVADCAGAPESCGTPTTAGTHIRFGGLFAFTSDDGSPLDLDVVADSSLNPATICGNVQVDQGSFVSLSAIAAPPGFPDDDTATGVFSSALVAAPTASYCVLGAQFTELDSTVTIAQSQVPTCPAVVDVHATDFFFLDLDPVTRDFHISVPPPPGELKGTFSVTGFPYTFINVFGSGSGPTIGDCAGASFFGAGDGSNPVSFDVNPALAGPWRVNATASFQELTTDGLFSITHSASPVLGSGYFDVTVAAGPPTIVPLAFTPAVLAGAAPVDARRWGAPTAEFNAFLTLEGATAAAEVVGAGWTTGLIAEPPMQYSESYALDLDPRGTNWVLRAAAGMIYGHDFPNPNGQGSSFWENLAAIPNVGANTPSFLPSGDPGVVIGAVTAGAHISADLPAIDFHVATVALNPVPGGISVFWSADKSAYPLPHGKLMSRSTNLRAFTFDGSPAIGRAKLPPGVYAGSTTAVDADFNALTEPRSLDLEPDDDLTADFGAPTLSQVRPIPGASGGATTVTGKVASGDLAMNALHVTVNGTRAAVGADGSFSAGATIGTGPLNVVAFDDHGRATTLKRYFTT